jgi:hypothetical protein
MWSYPTIFGNFSLPRVLGDGVRSQYTLTEPLPEHWLELIGKLDGPVEAPTPSSQPEAGFRCGIVARARNRTDSW